MKKYICMLFAAMFFIASAKQPITVKYKENNENKEIAGILSALDAYQVTCTLYADSTDAKFYELWMVKQTGNKTERTKTGYKYIETDSTKIVFTSIAKDSLNVIISVTENPRMTVSIPTTNQLLIGCDYEWDFNENDTIPLVAYATGVPTKYDMGDGRILEGFNICGLRFSKVPPSQWGEKYNITDYLYFEAVPVKEISF